MYAAPEVHSVDPLTNAPVVSNGKQACSTLLGTPPTQCLLILLPLPHSLHRAGGPPCHLCDRRRCCTPPATHGIGSALACANRAGANRKRTAA